MTRDLTTPAPRAAPYYGRNSLDYGRHMRNAKSESVDHEVDQEQLASW